MKNFKLIFSILALIIVVFAFVNAQECTYDGFIDEWVCDPGQECHTNSCICDATRTFIGSGEVCGKLCNFDDFVGEYMCNNGEYCPLGAGSQCICNLTNFINPGEFCGNPTVPSFCTYGGKTIYSGMTMQLYQTTTGLCNQVTITCNSNRQSELNTRTSQGYIYTGCVPSFPQTGSNCSLGGSTYPNGSIKTGYSVSSGNCTLNTIKCLNGLWDGNVGLVQYSTCISSSSENCSLGGLSYSDGSIKTGYSVSKGNCVLNTIRCLNGLWDGSIGLVQYSSCSSSNGGGGGGGGGGYYIPTCTFVDLVCEDGIYKKKSGVNCINGNLGNACSGTGITIITGNIATNDWLKPSDYTKIGDIRNSPYSTELNSAYLYAYNMGITTMPDIFKANLTGSLIRSHMAKMIVQWSKKVLGLKVNTGVVCKFNDIEHLRGEDLYDFVIESCQMGLMGLDNRGNPKSSFDPDSEVTRGQFGTALSRAIRGHYYDGGDPFYNYHLEALKSMKIMTKISKPWEVELRGRVMLMFHRAHVKLKL